MRILILIHEFPPIGGGGGAAARDICIGLVQRGHEVKVLTAHLHGLPQLEQLQGIEIIRLPSLRKTAFAASLLTMFAFDLAALWAGSRLISRWRPDVIHAHFAVPAGALAFLLSLLHHIPYILTAHLGDVPKGVPDKTDGWFRWIKIFTHPIWRNAAQVIAVSNFTRELALQEYNVPIDVIPNGVDLSSASPMRASTQVAPRIIFAGRFVEQKNPVQVVNILSQLQDHLWQCVMLGDGPLLAETQRKVTELGLQNRFTFPGWVSPQDVLDQFARADILFMPSKSEGLPVVGVQALANGLALVVSRAGGFVDLVDVGHNGFLHHWQDADEMAASLKKLLTNPSLLKSFQSHSLQFAQTFAIERVVDAYEQIITKCKKEVANDPMARQ